MKPESPTGLPKPGDKYEITVEGSLALLALGAKGILAWRKKRAEVLAQQKNSPAGDEQKDR